jgi:hypothetical protein
MMSQCLPRVEIKRVSQRLLSIANTQVLSPLIQSVGTLGSPGLRKVCSQFEHIITPDLCAWTALVSRVACS